MYGIQQYNKSCKESSKKLINDKKYSPTCKG